VELVFLNGNAVQISGCRTVVANLLNLPASAIPLKQTIEFTPDPLPSSHTEFAATTWVYDDLEPLTKIASVAPNWPEPWTGIQFLQETYAHELGHALFAALPKAARLEIAQMFGVESDDVAVLFPPGAPWVDHPGEGIAETFKDAFLPRGFRRYANRTNHTIPIHKYAEFRSLWRDATPQIVTGGEPLEEGETEVEGYNLDIFKQGGYQKTERFEDPFVPELGEVGEYLIGQGGFTDTLMREVYVGLPWELVGSFLQSEFQWEGWVKDGTTLTWELPLSMAPFEANGVSLELELYRPLPSAKVFFDGRWIRASEAPDGFTREGDATSFLPPTTVTDSMLVNSTNFGSTTIKCHKTTYRLVRLNGRLKLDLFAHTLNEHDALRQALLYSWLGPFPFIQAACVDGGEPGDPIILPASEMASGDVTNGRRRKDPTIVGRAR
jgi:hypothetical protein